MKKAFALIAATLITGATLILTTPLAIANDHGRVNWSINIGIPAPPVVYAQPQTVYVQPQPVYMQPQPVYLQPHPVYLQPQPVFLQPQPVYVEPAPIVEYGRVYYYDTYRRPYYIENGRRFYRSEWRDHHRRD
ncbi:MAG: hypothetical protein JWQ21_3124 [Herminiimonas sp.]|nr:hypothetical protein [Herminiimonas sp.]